MSAKQAAFLTLDHLEAFYGGSAGGGKSDALLAAALEYVDVPGYAALILRRSYTDLALPGAIMARADEWLSGSDARRGKDGKEWVFPSGATLTFAYLDNDQDRFRYKSAEFQFIAFDELTQFNERVYEYLFSRLRATESVPVPLRMRSASNPGDIGHGWVKRRFIERRDPGVIFVPAKLDDHPDESFKTGYRTSLQKLDEVTRRQYEDGDWDAAEGLAFDVRRGIHLIPEMEIPDGWDRFESMDFGVANPTCVLAWAVDYDGNVIVFDSYYRGNTLVSDHAAAIEALRQQWWPADRSPVCYADPSMWAKKGGMSRFNEPATDVTEFNDHGISGLVRANNHARPGRSRVVELLKQTPGRLFPDWHPLLASETGSPRMFIVEERCPELVEQMQSAPLLDSESGKAGAGEIVDPGWESHHGHAVAAVRYGAMSRPDAAKESPKIAADPRRALLDKVIAERNRPPRRTARTRYV